MQTVTLYQVFDGDDYFVAVYDNQAAADTHAASVGATGHVVPVLALEDGGRYFQVGGTELSAPAIVPASRHGVQIVRGYVDNTNYYSGATGTLQGVSGGFTYACLVEMFRRTNGGARFFWGTYRRFTGGGQGIGMDDDRFKMFLTQADGAKLENFVGAAFQSVHLLLGKLVVLHMVWNGTDMNLYVNGLTDVTPITPVGGLMFDNTVGPTWGVEGSSAKAYAFDGGILGAAYGQTAMTAAQVAAHARACMDAGQLVQDAGDTFINRYSASGMPGANSPATLLDLEGAVNLTQTGSLSMVTVSPKWAG